MRSIVQQLSIYAFAATMGCTASTATAQETTQEGEHQRVHIGLTYPVSTNGTRASQVSNSISLHALSGVSAGEHGVAFSGIATIIKGPQSGAVFSGLMNLVEEDARGANVAGLLNIGGGNIKGAQVAGLSNVVRAANGTQVAGLTNLSAANATVQVAGVLNIAGTSGLQLAGLSNTARHSNFQMAGLVNTTGTGNGQIAGLVNIARKVKGIQMAGLVNIAEESDYPIGFLNLIRKGEKSLGLTVDESGNAIVAFRSGSRKTYGILGLGNNILMPEARHAAEVGLGIHIPLGRVVRFNLELSNITNTNFQTTAYYKASFRGLLGIQLGKYLELVAGPSFNYVNYLAGYDPYVAYSLFEVYGAYAVNSFYVGGVAGIHFKL